MGFFENEDTAALVQSLIKIGEVSSIDPATATARVVFDDDDSLVSFDLPVLQRNTFANRDFGMPDVGEDVVCLFLPSGVEEGFILGSLYAGEVAPEESSGDVRSVRFGDETRVAYDRAAHELTVTVGDTSVTVTREGVEVVGADKVKASVGSVALTIDSGGATIDASSITLKGDTSIEGALSVSGDVAAQGDVTGAAGLISLTKHTHTAPGGSTSTPVVS